MGAEGGQVVTWYVTVAELYRCGAVGGDLTGKGMRGWFAEVTEKRLPPAHPGAAASEQIVARRVWRRSAPG